jgi:hypothetical protein
MRRACDDLEVTLAAVERARAAADASENPVASAMRAVAYMDLGAYLRAARSLRIAYRTSPADPAIASAYIDALVHARLTADADRVAANMTDARAGAARLEEARRSLSPRTAQAIPPPRGVDW